MQKTIAIARQTGMKVIYTTHVHRADGSDMGRYGDLYPPIESRAGLVDDMRGIEIYPELAPEPGSRSSRSTATAGSSARTSTSSCAAMGSPPSSSPGPPRRTAATPPPETPCSATTSSLSLPTPPAVSTTPTSDTAL